MGPEDLQALFAIETGKGVSFTMIPNRLFELGLIERLELEDSSDYILTDGGQMYVAALLAVKPPRKVWTMEK
jgi:hypothetical protein